MSHSSKKRRSSPAGVVTAAIVATAFGLTVGGCGSQAVPAAAGAASPAAGTRSASTPTRQVGTCEDGTSSSLNYYAPQIQAMLARAVAAWVPPPPADSGNGVAAQPGLHFVLRSVTTTSVSTDYPSIDYTVPAVGALAPQPSPADPSFNSDVHIWTAQQSGWKQSTDLATTDAATLAGQVRHYQVARNTYSAIYDCVASLVDQLGAVPGSDTRIALISDMENNEPVVGFSLNGAAVLVVGICPADVSASCSRRFAAARQFLTGHGASSVQIVWADAVTAQTFDSFWRS
jgi:hypothetical protein